jgi:hypothetical protein
LLRPSGNVLAAQLHQSAPLSRNAAFAAALDGIIGSLTSGPITDLSIEETVTVREGDLTTLTRSASGAGTFQWYRNGEQIGGATQPAHRFWISAADQGARFTLRFANGETNLMSRGITLNVLPDIEPPRLASAMLSLPGSVVVEFSEPVSAQAALDPANYILSTVAGARWPVAAVSSLNSTSVMVTLSGSMPGAGPWILGARNIADLAVNPNTIDPARRMSVGFEGELIGWTSFWRHLRELTNPLPAYREVDFDDSAWSLEQAVFDVHRLSPRTTVAGLPVNSFLTWEGASANEGRRTYFFRTKLELPIDPAATLFEAQSLVDDGVVVFVNGQEAFRLGVPPGETVSTFANRTVGTAGMEGPFVLPTHVFVPGDNFIVAQIHQVTMTSSDATFALRLTATARSFPVTIFPPTAGWEPMNTPAGALSSNSASSK